MHPLFASALAAERRRDQIAQATAARRAREVRRARRAGGAQSPAGPRQADLVLAR